MELQSVPNFSLKDWNQDSCVLTVKWETRGKRLHGITLPCVIFLPDVPPTAGDSFVSGAIGASETPLFLFLSRIPSILFRTVETPRSREKERNSEGNEKSTTLMVMHYSIAVSQNLINHIESLPLPLPPPPVLSHVWKWRWKLFSIVF